MMVHIRNGLQVMANAMMVVMTHVQKLVLSSAYYVVLHINYGTNFMSRGTLFTIRMK